MTWKEILKEISDDDLKKRGITNAMLVSIEASYNEMLDEIYPEIKIGTLTFSPSRVLRELDPTAYRIGLSEYEDEQVPLLEEELKLEEELNDGRK